MISKVIKAFFSSYHGPKHVETKLLKEGKWLRLKSASFDSRGKRINDYEFVERTTKRGAFDGIDVVGIVKYPETKQENQLILIASYRPPIDQYILEFPAGLIDGAHANCVEDAIRELKEETGYTASSEISLLSNYKSSILSPILYGDPWKSNEAGKIVALEVNGDDP
mmetsp:Transcript_22945/g.19910  ORF Transcript_22945/g.19910 Transcript_22945/m.19910 type:complete len:167 (+) Transcript_22945:104-604(+)